MIKNLVLFVSILFVRGWYYFFWRNISLNINMVEV